VIHTEYVFFFTQYVGLMKKNPGVDYKYFAPVKSKVSPEQTRWDTSKWTLCTEKCAGGKIVALCAGPMSFLGNQ
jgi:hypothetical protein